MKKTYFKLKTLAVLAFVATAFTMSSCSDDDSDDIDDKIDDVINKGPSLDDGYYIVGGAVSSDTTDANLLVQGQVNGDGIGSAPQDRPGFYEAYIYMGSGSFSFVKVEGDEVTEYGGAHTETADGDPEEITIYVGPFTEGGSPAESPLDGSLVHVSIDETTGQYVVIPVDYWEIIGSATETGWNSGIEIAQKSASADEVVFEATDVILRDGAFKFRFNGNWSMNLEEGECDAATTACYNYFTNFGGTVNELVHGGSDFVFDGTEGAYTVTLTYEPGRGNSITANLERTGDAPEITFDPAEYQFGVVGNAVNPHDADENGTEDGWESDYNMFYKGNIDGAHTWLAVVTFAEAGNFKLRTNDAWDFNLGGTLEADGEDATLAVNGSDIPSPGAGAYYITLKTADEGETWTATMVESGWGVIGEGSPQGNWDADIDMTADGVGADGVATYSLTGDFTTAEWKFRAGDSWDFNLGGDMAALSADGGNLSVSEDGTYLVVLSFDGETYSATATKQ